MARGEPRSLSLRMLAYLERLYQARGLRVSDVAAQVGVSDRAMRRYLNGYGVKLELFEQLCCVADISIQELARRAEGDVKTRMMDDPDRALFC